jgi:excisionase family DNA binding protein
MNERLEQPQFLSVPAAARLCGVTRNTVYTWVREGKLRAYQTPGRTNRIRPSDLVAFMNKHGMFVTPELSALAHEDEKLVASQQDVAEDETAVLVVDDEPSMRALVVRLLQGLAPVLQAETGYEALHLLTLHPNIKVVLLDLRMPGQHGLDTQREIIDLRPDVSVAIITGFYDEYAKEIITRGDVDRIFKKPFSMEEVQNYVRERISQLSTS